LLSACSGGPGATVAGVPSDFATKALAACQHARALIVAQGSFPLPSFNPTKPDVTQFPVVAAYLQKTATTWETWLSDLKALGEPSTGQAAWDDLVAGVQSHRDLNADQIAAAGSGDATTFAKDFAAGQKTQADVLKAATAAGVAACAEVDR
jgi:hypothetical protein